MTPPLVAVNVLSPPPPSPVLTPWCRSQIRKNDDILDFKPNDPEALQASGIAYAQLGKYKDAQDRLSRLVKVSPDNADAWLVLGEAQMAASEPGKAADAFAKYVEKGGVESVPLLREYSEALSGAGKDDKAVKMLQGAKERASKRNSAGGGAEAAERAVTMSDSEPADVVQTTLLIAKAYSRWEGHTADASAVYSAVCEQFPDDFRTFLARGVFLAEQGKGAEANKMFLQARYLAPESAKKLVDKVSNRSSSKL